MAKAHAAVCVACSGVCGMLLRESLGLVAWTGRVGFMLLLLLQSVQARTQARVGFMQFCSGALAIVIALQLAGSTAAVGLVAQGRESRAHP